MPKISDTYERAYAACDQLAAQGLRPTVKRVATHIGVNTPALISPAIRDWLVSSVVDRQERLQIPEVPEALVESVSALWRQAVAMARQALSVERAAFEQEKTGVRTALATLEATHAALDQKFSAYREAAEADGQQLRDTLGQRDQDLKDLRTAWTNITQDLTAARETIARLTGALETVQQDQVQRQHDWQTRLERDHHWHLQRIEEEKERAHQTAAEQVNQLESALMIARQHIATLNSYRDQSTHTIAELQRAKQDLQASCDRFQQQWDEMVNERNAAQQQLRVLEAELTWHRTVFEHWSGRDETYEPKPENKPPRVKTNKSNRLATSKPKKSPRDSDQKLG